MESQPQNNEFRKNHENFQMHSSMHWENLTMLFAVQILQFKYLPNSGFLNSGRILKTFTHTQR